MFLACFLGEKPYSTAKGFLIIFTKEEGGDNLIVIKGNLLKSAHLCYDIHFQDIHCPSQVLLAPGTN